MNLTTQTIKDVFPKFDVGDFGGKNAVVLVPSPKFLNEYHASISGDYSSTYMKKLSAVVDRAGTYRQLMDPVIESGLVPSMLRIIDTDNVTSVRADDLGSKWGHTETSISLIAIVYTVSDKVYELTLHGRSKFVWTNKRTGHERGCMYFNPNLPVKELLEWKSELDTLPEEDIANDDPA